MNLGRFHAVINLAVVELQRDKVVRLLSDLEDALQQSINQPNDDTAKNFRNKLDGIRNVLEKAESNRVHASQREILNEIGASGNIGQGLWLRIISAVAENNLTPSLAKTQITEIKGEVEKFYGAANGIDKAFTELDVEFSSLDPGEFEIGFLVPKNITSDRLESLKNELDDIDYCVRSFNEVATGDGGSLSVSTLSTSNWQIFLDSAAPTAACFALAIERIVKLYKSNLEIKLLKKQLEDKKFPDSVMGPMQEHIGNRINEELRGIGDEIVDEYYKGDEGRKNELKNRMPKALRYLADRIDRGASFEVNARLPKEAKPVDPSGKSDDTAISNDQSREDKELRRLVEFVDQRMEEVDKLEVQDAPTLLVNYSHDEGN